MPNSLIYRTDDEMITSVKDEIPKKVESLICSTCSDIEIQFNDEQPENAIFQFFFLHMIES